MLSKVWRSRLLENYGGSNACEKSGLGWLLLNCIYALQKDPGRLRTGRKQSVTKCESRRTSVEALRPVSPAGEGQMQLRDRLKT